MDIEGKIIKTLGTLGKTETSIDYHCVKLNNRKHITEFIQNFDNGKYPKLEQKGDC